MYIKRNMTKSWLISNGFRHNRLLSDEGAEVYTYRFPVFKYGKFTTLECELKVILNENEVFVNVYDHGTNNKYAPFYYCEYGNYDNLLKDIMGKINKNLDRFGIRKETRDGSKN